MPIGAFDEDTAVSRKTRRMGLRNCTPVPFVPFHSQIGRKRYESRKMDTCVIAILTAIADEMDE